MMVLANRCVGSLHICENCASVLAYTPNDVYNGNKLRCPVCGTMQECAMRLDYDGVVKLEGEKSDAPNC